MGCIYPTFPVSEIDSISLVIKPVHCYPLGVSNEYAEGSDCITVSTRKGTLVVVETVPDTPILTT